MADEPRIIRKGMSFIADLDPVDLQRLREIVFRSVLVKYPVHLRTNREADRLIESYGPKVREDLIRQAVDGKALQSDYRTSFG